MWFTFETARGSQSAVVLDLNRYSLYQTIVKALVEQLEKTAVGDVEDGGSRGLGGGRLTEYTSHLAFATHMHGTGSKLVTAEIRGRVRCTDAGVLWAHVHASVLQGRFPILQLVDGDEGMFAHLSLQEHSIRSDQKITN